MYKIDFSKPTKIHFIGIGGISMSGLAEILLKEGFSVSGSDSKESPLTQHLQSLGATITYPQAAENIASDVQIVVYTAAIHPDNPEFAHAKELGVPMLTTDYGSLRTLYCSCRHSRKDNNNLYDQSGIIMWSRRSYDIGRWYFKSYWQQYPCWRFRFVYYGSM